MFAEQLSCPRIENTHGPLVPLHLHLPGNPARRRTVVGCFPLHTSIQIHAALTELVEAEWLDGERQQGWLLFREHGRDLALGRAVDAGVGPAFLPAVQIGLSFLEALEAQSLQRRLLGVA